MHTGAHKLNNALGQVVLAQRLGKRRILAETGAGQHGVATATVCARFGLECVVYMGSEDMRRQAPNVERMRLLGAEVVPVELGTKTLKEATSEAIRDWIANVETSYYLIGSCVGPAPYPEIVRELQRVIGREAREQVLAVEGRLPDAVVACVGGGSNAIGMFYDFIPDESVRLIGVEAAGAASLGTGRRGRPARRALVGARRRRRPDPRRALDLGRPRLPGRRARARLPARQRARRVRDRDRRRRPGRLPPRLRDRGDRPGARVVARRRAGARPRRRAGARLPLRAAATRIWPRFWRREGRSMKTLVVYLMSGARHARAGAGRGRVGRRRDRARLSVLRPARRRAGHPPRCRACARGGHDDRALPRVPRRDAGAGRRAADPDDVLVAVRGARLGAPRARDAGGRRDVADHRRPARRRAARAAARAARRADVDRRADPAGRRARPTAGSISSRSRARPGRAPSCRRAWRRSSHAAAR